VEVVGNRGRKMTAMDHFGPRFSVSDAPKPARAWSHKAKTHAKPEPFDCIDSGRKPVLTHVIYRLVLRRLFPEFLHRVRTGISRAKYHYCSINTDGRTSENRWSICGNTVPWDCASFRIPLINKHLDLSQNGPPLANYSPPARVLLYWCPKCQEELTSVGEENEWLR
jgi:hypothetical protein